MKVADPEKYIKTGDRLDNLEKVERPIVNFMEFSYKIFLACSALHNVTFDYPSK